MALSSSGEVEVVMCILSVRPVLRDFHSEFFKYCPVLNIYYVISFLSKMESCKMLQDIKLPGLCVGDSTTSLLSTSIE